MAEGLKFDSEKVRPSLIPVEAMQGIAEVLEFGARKYARDNWKEVYNAEQRYLDALIRHLWAYQSGEDLDPESGLHHMKHIGCCVSFLLYFIEQKRLGQMAPPENDEDLAEYFEPGQIKKMLG